MATYTASRTEKWTVRHTAFREQGRQTRSRNSNASNRGKTLVYTNMAYSSISFSNREENKSSKITEPHTYFLSHTCQQSYLPAWFTVLGSPVSSKVNIQILRELQINLLHRDLSHVDVHRTLWERTHKPSVNTHCGILVSLSRMHCFKKKIVAGKNAGFFCSISDILHGLFFNVFFVQFATKMHLSRKRFLTCGLIEPFYAVKVWWIVHYELFIYCSDLTV